jgi:hypothetical protein
MRTRPFSSGEDRPPEPGTRLDHTRDAGTGEQPPGKQLPTILASRDHIGRHLFPHLGPAIEGPPNSQAPSVTYQAYFPPDDATNHTEGTLQPHHPALYSAPFYRMAEMEDYCGLDAHGPSTAARCSTSTMLFWADNDPASGRDNANRRPGTVRPSTELNCGWVTDS